jgi:nucleoside-diphosphate-sugar epimerase
MREREDYAMDVVITGAYGRVGTALLDYTDGQFDYIPFDRREHPRLDTIVGDVTEFDAIRSALQGVEAVVHLAADPKVETDWSSVLENNIVGTYNCLEACRQCGVETAVLSSSNHVVGMYERDHAPHLYEKDYELLLDHRTPVRPDSLYGVSKAFLEALGRYYVEQYECPSQVYALRIGSVRYPMHDHPYGDAERGVEAGRWTRDSNEYRREVKRMKATWHSRRDLAGLVERCLEDDAATFEIFYGVSDNERRWFDINRPRHVVGYNPHDSGEEWDEPPARQRDRETVAFDSTE